MKANLIKYKHYLILLTALLFSSYLVVPLWELQQELRSEIKMLKKQLLKIDKLIGNETIFDERGVKAKQKQAKSEVYIFQQPNEAKLKLDVQLKLEHLFTDANCEMGRVSWKNASVVDQTLTRWTVEVRFKGNPSCIIKTTRSFATAKPLMRIQDFDYSARRINGEVRNKITATLKIMILQSTKLAFTPNKNDVIKGAAI